MLQSHCIHRLFNSQAPSWEEGHQASPYPMNITRLGVWLGDQGHGGGQEHRCWSFSPSSLLTDRIFPLEMFFLWSSLSYLYGASPMVHGYYELFNSGIPPHDLSSHWKKFFRYIKMYFCEESFLYKLCKDGITLPPWGGDSEHDFPLSRFSIWQAC